MFCHRPIVRQAQQAHVCITTGVYKTKQFGFDKPTAFVYYYEIIIHKLRYFKSQRDTMPRYVLLN